MNEALSAFRKQVESENVSHRPPAIRWLLSTQTKAEDVVTGEVNLPVNRDHALVMVAQGEFVVTTASIPYGAKPPRGRYLYEVVDLEANGVGADGMVPHRPDLRRLGVAHLLNLSAR